jgi:hypothetical protein
MFVALFLSDRIEVEILTTDTHRLVRGGKVYEEINRDWEKSLYLGFYDWLRTVTDEVIGVNVILHDGREILREVLPNREYIEWLAPSVVRITFLAGDVDEAASTDQAFSVSRCFRSDDGTAALLFDANDLTNDQLEHISSRASLGS